jgi:hypothetical protein
MFLKINRRTNITLPTQKLWLSTTHKIHFVYFNKMLILCQWRWHFTCWMLYGESINTPDYPVCTLSVFLFENTKLCIFIHADLCKLRFHPFLQVNKVMIKEEKGVSSQCGTLLCCCFAKVHGSMGLQYDIKSMRRFQNEVRSITTIKGTIC